MKIAVHGRPFTQETIPYIRDMFELFREHNIDVKVFEPLHDFLRKQNINTSVTNTYNNKEALQDRDFIFSIGGDGTLLDTITYIGDRETPVVGINTGRLGFLATTPRESIKTAIDCLEKGDYITDARTMIWLDADPDIFPETGFGLNEFTILKRDSSSMIVVHTYLNNEFLNSYWADGLIVATPTGSTGYSLSCGGPLVLPHSNNFIITPVSPHNLNVRPMVVSDDSELSFRIEGRSNNFLVSMDSRSKSVNSSTHLCVRKCPFKTKIVQLPNYKYLNTLRNKLNWGLDIRN